MAKKGRTSRKQARAFSLPVPEFVLLPAVSLSTVHARRRRWAFVLSVFVFIELLASASLFAWRQPVNQVNVAGIFTGRTLNSKTLARALNQAETNYRLLVRYPDKSMRAFSLKDMGMHIDAPKTVAAAQAAQHSGSLFHHAEWWRVTPVPLQLTVDEQAFQSFLQTRVAFTAVQPVDAHLSIENGTVKEVDGHDGQRYSLPDSAPRIKTAAANLDSTPLAPGAETIGPQITHKDLAKPKQQVEDILDQSVVFHIEDKTANVPRATIGSWLDLAPAPERHSIDVTVNSGRVLAYINQLTASSIHSARSQIVATADDGSTTVLVAGSDGADIRGRDSFAAKAASQLSQAKAVDIDLPVTHTPHKTINAQAYPKWIEVDLTTKHMYAYEGLTPVREMLISAGAPATPTVTGQYAIYAKYRSQTMSGPNADGSHYIQPNVPYVNYFYRDYAIHGNYWRPASYFGNINSSHGCVGIRDPDSAWVYSWAPLGTPVIVHT